MIPKWRQNKCNWNLHREIANKNFEGTLFGLSYFPTTTLLLVLMKDQPSNQWSVDVVMLQYNSLFYVESQLTGVDINLAAVHSCIFLPFSFPRPQVHDLHLPVYMAVNRDLRSCK